MLIQMKKLDFFSHNTDIDCGALFALPLIYEGRMQCILLNLDIFNVYMIKSEFKTSIWTRTTGGIRNKH